MVNPSNPGLDNEATFMLSVLFFYFYGYNYCDWLLDIFFCNFEIVIIKMKDKTIDYILRVTWQAVARMYNEEASKFDGSMAIGFACSHNFKQIFLDVLGNTATVIG